MPKVACSSMIWKCKSDRRIYGKAARTSYYSFNEQETHIGHNCEHQNGADIRFRVG